MKSNFENDVVKFWFEEGILCGQFKLSKMLHTEEAKEVVRLRLRLTAEQHYPCFIDANNTNSISKEVREYFATPESCQYISAGALLVHNPVQKVIANVFLYFNRAPFPSKMFTDKHKAMMWLKQYR